MNRLCTVTYSFKFGLNMKKQKQRLVYSTDTGRLCPDCNQSINECTCKTMQNKTLNAESDGIVRIARETKGRKGKGVTLVTGLVMTQDEMSKLAKKLKQVCGTGGAVKQGVIEIQGDKRDAIKTVLEKQGYTVKLAGG